MLRILNQLCHGYVAIAVIAILKKHGFFQVLNSSNPTHLSALIKTLKANKGSLGIALHLLEALGWVFQNPKGGYQLTAHYQTCEIISEDILPLYRFNIDEALLSDDKFQKLLGRWIPYLLNQDHTSQSFQLLQGPILVPVLMAIPQQSCQEVESFLKKKLPPSLCKEIHLCFRHLGWGTQEHSSFVLTELGREILKRVHVMGIAASYRPMLSHMEELLFGDANQIFKTSPRPNKSAKAPQPEESHIDRRLNVIASGSQHERYFGDAETQILTRFSNTIPLGKQPKYIADMGCGDGTFLKQIYHSICEQTQRGLHLQDHPVTLIGIDYNADALKESEKTLKGLPHITLRGDINDPEKLLSDLEQFGIHDPENILHIRSFLDHNFRYTSRAAKYGESPKTNGETTLSGVYVDSSGNALSPQKLVNAWRFHLQKWANALQDNSHGLLVLESHCLSPEITKQYFLQSENFYFDALHAFSRQYLLDAEIFIVLAANVGLFAKSPPLCYPKTLPFCRITLSHFEKRDYIIRQAQESDLKVLYQLESLCWSKNLQTPKAKIAQRLNVFPQGQFVLELDKQVVGVIYSQRINAIENLEGKTSRDDHLLHVANGPIVQLLAVNINPNTQDRSLGNQLLEFMLQRCSLMNSIQSVVGVSRCKDYEVGGGIAFEHYIHSRDERGNIKDSILRFHELHGATIKKVLFGYRPKDLKNEGHGVLIHYEIRNRTPNQPNENKLSNYSSSTPSTEQKEKGNLRIKTFINRLIRTFLGHARENAYFPKSPLMEMGLDSADLLELQEQVQAEYQIKLEPVFFFQYNTPEKIIAFLQATLSNSPCSENGSERRPERFIDFPRSKGKDIAIVGAACRLPGNINNPNDFWQFLKAGGSGIRDLPEGRFRWPVEIDPSGEFLGINRGGFLEDIASFDASFFRISPKEAESMDPQQRILMEMAWHCLEDSGHSPESMRNSSTSVFIGASGSDYYRLLEQANLSIDAHFGTGSAMAMLANRISYFFDFVGPSFVIDTACSSSLVAVHQAVRSLQREECEYALVGGINLICHPGNSIAYYKSGMLSKEGQCRTFDKEANGYVRAEGAVMLLLKPLALAEIENDRIYSVILGSACNHGGQAGGLTVPNPKQQAVLLQEAWAQSAIAPETLGYLETHGTGTPLGDPIEIQGIKEAFSNHQFEKSSDLRCGLGSLKSNLGHLEATSGIAGLLKASLSLGHQEIPPTINFKDLNPQIQLKESPFYIAAHPQIWRTVGERDVRRAGVSSFGFGGANAHVVLEEYRRQPTESSVPVEPLPFMISAKNLERLEVNIQTLLNYLQTKKEDDVSLPSLVYTLQKRQSMEERFVCFARSLAELEKNLKCFLGRGTEEGGCYRGNVKDGEAMIQPFLISEKMKRVVEQWIVQKEIREIAKLWVNGLPVNWDFLFETGPQSQAGDSLPKPSLVDLPVYSFKREYYWLPESKSPKPQQPVPAKWKTKQTIAGENESDQVWEMYSKWNPCLFEQNFSDEGKIDDSKLLVISALDTIAETVLENLIPDRQHIVLPKFVDLKNARLLIDTFWACMENIKLSIKTLQPARCLLLSNTNQDFSAMLYAALQSIQKEQDLPALWFSWDKPLLQSSESIIQSILKNAVHSGFSAGERRMTLQAGVVGCQEKSWDYKQWSAQLARSGIRQGGVYWITGGNGGIGRKIAYFLANEYNATVILSGRSKLILMESQGDLFPSKRGVIQYRVADCCKHDDMASLFSWIQQTYGRLTGVIHAAGVLRDQELFFKTKEDVSAVMESKLVGTLILDDVTKNASLDCFVLFSSLTALLGNAGQTDYAAANAFLKQFAEQRRKQVEQGQRVGTSVVVHWPYWENGGMQLTKDQIWSLKESLGTDPLPENDGLAFFETILGRAQLESSCVYRKQPFYEASFKQAYPNNVTEINAPFLSASSHAQSDLATIQKTVKKILSDLIVVDENKLDPSEHFTDYGVDSILLQSFVRQINLAFSLGLTPLSFHNHPTIRELSELILVPPTESNVSQKTAEFSSTAQNGTEPDGPTEEAIAIVGVNIRVPGAASLDSFWDLLMDGSSSVVHYPEERWERLPEELVEGERRETFQGLFLEDILGFDHRLFKTSPREAMLMDPQQRLLLQSVWHAIENAGYSRSEFSAKSTSVFLSINNIDYADISKYDEHICEYTGSGISRYIAANRISHFFDLQGLSEPIDTACSSFFVGLERAISSLKAGYCNQTIVAGVQLNLLPRGFHELKEKGILSQQNKTLSFDYRADGFIRGEGVGTVILKPLQQAINDNDHIYAVLKGVGVWHAGKSMGVTAPNSIAHQKAMKRALDKSLISVDQITYLEGHGTGMPLGDASEVEAFTQVFKERKRNPERTCFLSATKPTLGHLEAASGVAVLIKAILALQKGMVPGVSGYQKEHPDICLDGLKINHQPQFLSNPEEPKKQPHCVGLNSYGLGGVSAFVLLEEYPIKRLTQQSLGTTTLELFVLSAQSQKVLNRYLNDILQFLIRAERNSVNFQDLIANYQKHREPMPCRLAIITYSVEDLIIKIQNIQQEKSLEGIYFSNSPQNEDWIQESALPQWVEQKDWESIAKAWVAGGKIPWPHLDHARSPFPEYPFDMERKFWISRKEKKENSKHSNSQT